MATELERLRAEREAVIQEGVAHRFLRKHLKDIEPCIATSELLGEYLASHNMAFTEENLEIAADALGDSLARPSHQPAFQAPPPPAAPTLDDVAPIPSYFPPMNNNADIGQIPGELYKKLFFGPQAEKFKARIAAIQEGVPAATSTTQTAPVGTTRPVAAPDAGLPPAPAGLVWASTVAELNAMPREEFRHLYHSQRYGEQFRKRIEAIYARERGQR